MNYDYYINLNERGEFYADVRRESDDQTVYAIHGVDIFEDGFMANVRDMAGLKQHLQDANILTELDTLTYIG